MYLREVISMKSNVFIDYLGQQVEEKELIKKAKALWVSKGNKVKDLTELNVYVKPEENVAYCVFNNNDTDKFNIY